MGLQLRTRAGLARDPAGPRISPPGGNLGGPWGTGPHIVLAVRWEPGRPRASLATARCPVSTKPLKCQLTLKPVPDWSRGGGSPAELMMQLQATAPQTVLLAAVGPGRGAQRDNLK